MRTVIGTLGGISVLFVGIFAISQAAQQAKGPAVENGTNATGSAYNTSTEVFGAIGQTAGPGVALMGIAAVILVFLGFLVYVGRSGR